MLIQGDILLWIEGLEKTSYSERSQKIKCCYLSTLLLKANIDHSSIQEFPA